MSFGGPNRVDGRLLALLRTMYCRDRRLFALSNVTYEVKTFRVDKNVCMAVYMGWMDGG